MTSWSIAPPLASVLVGRYGCPNMYSRGSTFVCARFVWVFRCDFQFLLILCHTQTPKQRFDLWTVQNIEKHRWNVGAVHCIWHSTLGNWVYPDNPQSHTQIPFAPYFAVGCEPKTAGTNFSVRQMLKERLTAQVATTPNALASARARVLRWGTNCPIVGTVHIVTNQFVGSLNRVGGIKCYEI